VDRPELRRRQAPGGDRENLRLFLRDDGVAAADVVFEGAPRQLLQVGGEIARQHRRLVGDDDEAQAVVELGETRRQLGVERCGPLLVAAFAAVEQGLDLLVGASPRLISSTRWRIRSSSPGRSFLALTSTCSRTPTLPKSCRRAA